MTPEAAPAEPQSALRMPPTLVILLIILLLAAIAGRILPAGKFDREQREIKKSGIQTIDLVVAEGDTIDTIVAKGDDATTAKGILKDGQPVSTLTPGETIQLTVHVTEKRTVVVAGTYKPAVRETEGNILEVAVAVVAQVLAAPLRGFQDKADIIAFILLIGGAFGMLLATGAIDNALLEAVRALEKGGAPWLVIPALMILFSAGGAIFGMSEEVIPFVMITIPLAIRLGYDSITGLMMSWVAAGLGFAGAFFNPFTLQIAQGIAELAPLSGTNFRVWVWISVTALGIVYALWWAARVKAKPELSPTYENDRLLMAEATAVSHAQGSKGMRAGDWLVLASLAATVALIIWGVTAKGWYLNELSAAFLCLGILSAVFGGLGFERGASAFMKGASELAPAALIVAFSAGILKVMEDGMILDTILNWIASSLEGTHSVVAANLMFLLQSALNFFVPSGSGQAAMTMPIVAPLSDLLGVTRQTSVLAFQFGDGFGNLIIPTSAVTMSVLGIARIRWETWALWVLPFMGLLFLFSMVTLTIAVLTGYN